MATAPASARAWPRVRTGRLRASPRQRAEQHAETECPWRGPPRPTRSPMPSMARSPSAAAMPSSARRKRPTARVAKAAHELQPAQHAKRAEGRGRGPDHVVRRLVDVGGQQVARDAGQERGENGQPAAQPAPERGDEYQAGHGVAGHVHGVRVQGQRGDGAPHFVVLHDGVGHGAALAKPALHVRARARTGSPRRTPPG